MTSQLPHSVKEISAFSFNRIIEDGENLGLNQNIKDGNNSVLNQLMWLLYNFMSGSVISKDKQMILHRCCIFLFLCYALCRIFYDHILLIGQMQMLWNKAMYFELSIAQFTKNIHG